MRSLKLYHDFIPRSCSWCYNEVNTVLLGLNEYNAIMKSLWLHGHYGVCVWSPRGRGEVIDIGPVFTWSPECIPGLSVRYVTSLSHVSLPFVLHHLLHSDITVMRTMWPTWHSVPHDSSRSRFHWNTIIKSNMAL